MNTMYITCNREALVGDACIGSLFIDGTFFCNTLEDLPREGKVVDETCIPVGTYQVGFREVLTPMTKKYQKKGSWFTWHLEIKDIPNFLYVYFHVGNKASHSSGCVLLGRWLDKKKPFISNSGVMYRSFYNIVSDHLKLKGRVVYEIKDFTSDLEEPTIPEINNKTSSWKFWK